MVCCCSGTTSAICPKQQMALVVLRWHLYKQSESVRWKKWNRAVMFLATCADGNLKLRSFIPAESIRAKPDVYISTRCLYLLSFQTVDSPAQAEMVNECYCYVVPLFIKRCKTCVKTSHLAILCYFVQWPRVFNERLLLNVWKGLTVCCF